MTPGEAALRESLEARRARLAALAGARREEQLVELVRRVDAALAAVEIGEWSLCTVCHEPITEEPWSSDPLIRVCLECLTADERRALERDLEAAAKVQRALLPPRQLVYGGWEVAFLWEPRGAVSGDHVDLVVPRGAGEPLHLLLGDVSGKGIAASLLQAHLHALFRALASAETSPAELLERANRLFVEAIPADRFATLAALRLHGDGRVELANAGHPRPLLADARGVRPVEGGGLPIGLFAGATYSGHDLRMAAGETLLLYSDGLAEAERDDEEYGIGRAAAALRRAAARAPVDVLAEVRADLERFLAGASRSDDLTLLVLRRSAVAPGS